MRIPLQTISLNELALRAIAHQIGKKRPATSQEVRGWVEKLIDATLEDLVVEYERAIETTETSWKGACSCRDGARRT